MPRTTVRPPRQARHRVAGTRPAESRPGRRTQGAAASGRRTLAATRSGCRTLGVAGSVAVAVGGISAGAVPAQDPLRAVTVVSGLRDHPELGLACVYFGLVLLVAAWWRLGREVRGADPPSPAALRLTLALWAAPLLVAFPMFSRDVYSYLAQGEMVAAGLDVYRYGPATLGGPLAAEVPSVWQHAPAPYGPVFLAVAAAVAAASGGAVVLGLLGMRLVAVAGVGLIAAVLPGLARRWGVDPGQALWLGALNPLVLVHLVAGAHNEALMVGLLAAGLAAAAVRRPALATVLVTLAALVKAPAVLALAAVAAIWAGQLTGRWRWPRAALGVAALAGGTAAAVTAAMGTGYGWVGALRTPVVADNWSLTSTLGRLTGALLDATGAELAVDPLAWWRWVGLAAAGTACLLLWHSRDRLGPGYALGLALTAVVAFGPVIRPWYALWALVPIAAAAPDGRVRRAAVWACAGLAVVVLPHGFSPQPGEVGLAVLGGSLAALLVVVTTWDGWRR